MKNTHTKKNTKENNLMPAIKESKDFVLANDNIAGNDQVSIDSFKRYFLPRVKIENYNI